MQNLQQVKCKMEHQFNPMFYLQSNIHIYKKNILQNIFKKVTESQMRPLYPEQNETMTLNMRKTTHCFGPAEDARLTELKVNTNISWPDLAAKMRKQFNTTVTVSQCAARWSRIKPEIRRQIQKKDDSKLIVELFVRHGPDFKLLANHVQDRTPQGIAEVISLVIRSSVNNLVQTVENELRLKQKTVTAEQIKYLILLMTSQEQTKNVDDDFIKNVLELRRVLIKNWQYKKKSVKLNCVELLQANQLLRDVLAVRKTYRNIKQKKTNKKVKKIVKEENEQQ